MQWNTIITTHLFVNLTYLVIHYICILSIIHILHVWHIVVNLSLGFFHSYVWNHRNDQWSVWKYHVHIYVKCPLLTCIFCRLWTLWWCSPFLMNKGRHHLTYAAGEHTITEHLRSPLNSGPWKLLLHFLPCSPWRDLCRGEIYATRATMAFTASK